MISSQSNLPANSITEEKYNSYFFALKCVFNLHKKHKFGKSPDIPSGFSESLCRHILELLKGSDRTNDAVDHDGVRFEIKATGTKEGKTTISNNNEFDLLIWMFVDFENNSVCVYKLPRRLFCMSDKQGRSSITLSSIASKNGINPELYIFHLPSQDA